MKKLFKFLMQLLLVILLLVGAYFAYMHFSYYRIEDNLDLSSQIENNRSDRLELEKEYSMLTFNFGFGAHDKDFSFFMDKGRMKDGTPVRGTMSIASSKEKVIENTQKLVQFLKRMDADFVLLQEVDQDSTRGYHVDQHRSVVEEAKEYASIFDTNLHVKYLLYPITEPHGMATSGLLTLSRYRIDSAVHRQLYINEGFIERFVDLDRCFTSMKVPVEGGRELILINLHLSAYDKGGTARKEQLTLLNEVMQEEYDRGNYVILGGDFNHILSDSYKELKTEQEKPHWVFLFPEESLSPSFRIIHSENADEVGTCRTSDLPYEEGVNYRAVIDGFIVSDNVEASSEIIDEKFEYTDHNPVLMKFKLKQ